MSCRRDGAWRLNAMQRGGAGRMVVGCGDSAMPEATELLTYLTGVAEPDPGGRSPRVGDAVHLRPLVGGPEIEAWSEAGKRLGRLPPAERDALAGLVTMAPGELRARIAAMVPRPALAGMGRIHIRVTAAAT